MVGFFLAGNSLYTLIRRGIRPLSISNSQSQSLSPQNGRPRPPARLAALIPNGAVTCEQQQQLRVRKARAPSAGDLRRPDPQGPSLPRATAGERKPLRELHSPKASPELLPALPLLVPRHRHLSDHPRRHRRRSLLPRGPPRVPQLLRRENRIQRLQHLDHVVDHLAGDRRDRTGGKPQQENWDLLRARELSERVLHRHPIV